VLGLRPTITHARDQGIEVGAGELPLAAGHIRRVLALAPAPAGKRRAWYTDPYLVTALVLTVVLDLLLAGAMQAQAAQAALPDLALRAVILALVAVSVPHVVLISFWAAALGRDSSRR
jgi:hypothetical protein